MRITLLVAAALLAVVGAAFAQEPADHPGSGRVGVDLVAAPAFGFGVPLRLTRNLTLRATAGFGSAVAGGAAFAVGGDLRYSLRPGARWSPYFSGQASYLHASSADAYSGSGPAAAATGGSSGLFGGGLGVRRQFGPRTSAYTELRYGRLTSTGVYDSWGMWGVGGSNTVSLALGATFGLR